MAIKIFVGSYEVIETAVNQFMKDKGKDFPVRTNTEIVDGKLVFIATVFYTEVNDMNVAHKVAQEIVKTTDLSDITKTIPFYKKIKGIYKESNKIGALWQSENKITGNINDKKVIMTKDVWENLETKETKAGDTMKILRLDDGNDARIVKNQYKKTANHPDWVVLK